MSGVKCSSCGLVNFAAQTECRRCGAAIALDYRDAAEVSSPGGLKNKLLKSALRIAALAGFILFLGYASLISTSDPASLEQRQIVDRAIDVLDKRGFDREAF